MLTTPMEKGHVAAVTQLHCAALAGLLTRLGPVAVRAYYAGALRTGAAVGLVAEDDGELAGFAMGSVRPDDLKRQAWRRNPLGVSAGLAIGIVRHPSNLGALLSSQGGAGRPYDAGAPELTYIAVAKPWRGSGVAAELLDAFTSAMRGRGVARYELSVERGNQAARAFYERHGLRQIGEYREWGRDFVRYALIPPQTDGEGVTHEGSA